ncbi:MAG: hypothetical protein AAFZ65_04525 [Planctomycetota bacterium]
MGGHQNPSRDPSAAAAIDLGSESVLLLIARRGEKGQLTVLEDHALSGRLASCIEPDGSLDEGPLERTLEVLETLARRIELAGVEPSRRRLVATAAARRLRDPSALVERVRARTGLTLEVISAELEGRLAFAGAIGTAAEKRGAGEPLLIDVGGGSTEVVWSGGSSVRSLPFGAAVGARDHFGLDGTQPRGDAGLDAWRQRVRSALETLDELRGLGADREAVVIGGTASNLACLEAGGETFDLRTAEGATISAAAAERWAETIADLDFESRLDLPIEPQRADLLAPGLVCLAESLRRVGSDQARVTGRGLRHALVKGLLEPASA